MQRNPGQFLPQSERGTLNFFVHLFVIVGVVDF
jgi:hypothetical protein